MRLEPAPSPLQVLHESTIPAIPYVTTVLPCCTACRTSTACGCPWSTLHNPLDGHVSLAVLVWHLMLDAILLTAIYSSSMIGHIEPLTCLCLLTGDMSGPSSMSQPPNEADMPPAASSAAAGLPSAAGETSRFKAGARVFFDSNGVPVKGTVAKPHSTGEGVHVPTVLRPAQHCMFFDT